MYGSDLWKIIEEKDIKSTANKYSIIADKHLGLGRFTSDELFAFCAQANRRFYLRPKYLLDQLIQSIVRKNFNIIKMELYNF